MNWTEKQLKTIEARGTNVLVSAAAGSGKTAVLTERILRLVTQDRVPLKEMLVVTFTEAAASEMKSRIASALTAASENDEFAETQLRQLGTAKIMTFHSFCLTILRRHYYAIGIDPSFAIADEKRAEALKEDALDEVMDAAFADEDEVFRTAFTEFLLAYADVRSERKARGKILKAYEFIMTLPNPFEWLAEGVGALFATADVLAETPAIKFAYGEIEYRLTLARTLTEQVGELLFGLGLSGLAAKNANDLESVSDVERKFLARDMDGTRLAIESLKFETFRASADEKEVYEGIKALVKLRRDRVKGILKKEVGEAFFARAASEYSDEIAHTAPYARTLETLVGRFAEAYARIKRTEKVIDFADFEHMALKILEDENIANDYRRRLAYVFIDEYQDSNYVQEALLSRLSHGDNLFMVGDVKQSIYSFRNAAPEIFLEKQVRYRATPQGIRIDLSSNFRSKAGVIDAVNAVFENLMESHYSCMDYDEDARLVKGVSSEPGMEGAREGATRLHLIAKDTVREVFDNDAEGEASLCAGIIRETVGQEFYDAKHGVRRPLRYSDIAILLRATSGAADIYRKTLESHGIPAVTDRGEGYFEAVEIDTFLGLLRAIVNLRRDVPLAAAMCSAVFGFELAELADIRADHRDGFFYTAFLAYAEGGEDAALREKCAAMASQLSRWRDEERFMRLDDFLWKLMRESGFYDYVGGLPRGTQRQANLRSLLDRAAGFQSGHIDGLRGFLAFLDRIKLRGGVPQVTLLTGGEDVCRIMTIHGSKGLEFPVVLLGGLGKSLLKGGFSDDALLLHRDAGLSLEWMDSAMHTRKKTLLHQAVKLRQDVVERAEAIRLLYVGMTRAMDTLHMIGTIRDPEKLVEAYGADEVEPGIDTDVFGASNYLRMVLPTAMQRKGCVEVSIVGAGETGQHGALDFGAGRPDRSSTVCDKDDANLGRTIGSDPQDPNLRAALSEPRHSTQSPADMPTGEASPPAPYVYPHAASAMLKSKYSVTELSTPAHPQSPTFFMAGGSGETDEDAGLTAAEKGTAMHKALEALDYAEAYAHRDDRAWFEGFLAALVRSSSLNDVEAEAVGTDTLMLFAGSELIARAVAADFLMKEAPFNMKLPYGEAVGGQGVRPAASETQELSPAVLDEEIVVQGVMDCLFEEDDGLVVADYKTGWFDVSAYDSEAERIRSAYGAQLRLYRRAAELIFGKPVKESLIYMTRSGVTVDIP
ncbi:MAG: helicase-exonuclease AddAB subunit AddA [Clostridiales bacterium]|nr:helicase-exonuclease AddAB subunit AddA [Clostridiales bacterium]